MIEAQFPMLSLVIFLPLLAAVLTGISGQDQRARSLALLFAVLELILTLLTMTCFNVEQIGFQLVERYVWIASLNIEFFVGIDGISILFLPFTALLTVIAILASWNTVKKLNRFHFALLLALEGVTMGVFSALDMVLFFLFWELTVPPIFFLIGLWGIGPQRRSAAMKYTLYMLFAGVPILFAIIMLAINHAEQVNASLPQGLNFSFPLLLQTAIPEDLQVVIFILFVIGFSVKAPLLPFHTWLPMTAMEAPVQMTALLTGLKLGAFGLLRFALPLTPYATVKYSWALGMLGACTIVYAALIALRQTNLRRLLAYASISHVGLVVVGIASLNIHALQGAIFQLLNFTLVASSLMIIAGFIRHRLGSTEVSQLGGLAKVVPKLTCFYFLFALASIGVPLTNGFPAELLLIIGALSAHPSLALSGLLGAVLGAAYMLNFIRLAFWGPVTRAAINQIDDLRIREWGLLGIPAVLVLLLGLFPNLALDFNHKSSESWLQHILIVSDIQKNK